MGVGEDFLRFRTEYNLDAATMASIAYRYRRITRQLNLDFWGSSSETAHSKYVGSYGRDTAAYGVSDLDIGFILPGQIYSQYDSRLYNGQSALLQAVKASIQRTYATSETFGDGQVVVVAFTDGITFEILPAFERSDGSWTFPNSNWGGSWKKCNPRAEIAAIKAANHESNKNLKYLCRMMRVWRDAQDVQLSGMLIDTLAYRFMQRWPYRDRSFAYHDYMAKDFFRFLASQPSNQSYWHAPGSNSLVWRTGAFQTKARSAYRLALSAIDYDLADQHWSRRRTWRQIFGPRFPA